MAPSKFDLMLHPVRLQILHAFEHERKMTTQELGARLADIPTATLYRHLNILLEGGMLRVAEERVVHGATERVYMVAPGQTRVTKEERRMATPADHQRYFTTFVAGMLGMFTRYLKQPKADVVRDGVGYRQVTLQLSDNELETFMKDLDERFNLESRLQPGEGRRPRVFSWIVMPEVQPDDEG
jgi:DNA-binding transcriptional ArsR family regulator